MSVTADTPQSAPGAAGQPAIEGSGEVVLELDAVTKVYPAEPPVVALRGVSFSVRRGELVAIVGPSGSGKTTLLHVMGTLERPTAGAVRITGLDVAGLDDRALSVVRAKRIGFVFQLFFLAEYQTVLDNVAVGRGAPARRDRARTDRHARDRARRRADRESRHRHGERDLRALERAARERRDDCDDHPRP